MNCKFPTPIFFFFLFIATPSLAKIYDLGTVGETYPVVEPDVAKDLKQKAAALDRGNNDSLLEQIKKYQPAGLQTLPRAAADKTFLVDMAYTLDRDLVDGDGKVIYPRGYTFNPLDYISFPGGLVVLDGDDPSQIKWYKTSPYFENHQARLLLSNGYAFNLIEELQRPIFYLTDDIARRLQLTAVPSVVIQKGDKMQVQEIYVPPGRQGELDESE